MADRDPDPGQSWMRQLQAGDESAFRSLVQHYGPRVFAFFRRYGADRGQAEDLAQEAFLRIYRARERYQPRARFTTWLHRILHRMAMNEAARNRWRRARPLVTDEGHDDDPQDGVRLDAAPDAAEDPMNLVSMQEVRARVREAVESLPPRQRSALLMNRFEGLSYQEVGEALGLKVAAVKSLLFRARENVKDFLAPFLREEDQHELPRTTDLDR